MKLIPKILAGILVFAMAFCLLPVLEAPAKAASTPILVLSSTTAVNPILDHVLDFETFGSGGPFTIEWEWKCELKSNDPSDAQAFRAGVSVTGTIYGSTTVMQWDAEFEGYNPPKITGKTDWTKGSFQFQDVGVYGVSGTNYPGNILRFSLWKARGSVYVRNLMIKNAAGEVVYNMNTDPVMTALIEQMEGMGVTECDMGELAAIDYANCPWVAGQFASGNYSSKIMLEGAPDVSTSSSITRPTTSKPTTSSGSSDSSSSSSRNTTVTTKPATITTEPTTMGDLPCYGGNHDYVDGVCTYCGEEDPDYVPPVTDPTTEPTTVPTTEPTSVPTVAPSIEPTVSTTAPVVNDQNTTDGESGGMDPVVWIIIAVAVALVAGGAAFFVLKGKKKA